MIHNAWLPVGLKKSAELAGAEVGVYIVRSKKLSYMKLFFFFHLFVWSTDSPRLFVYAGPNGWLGSYCL